MAQTYFYNGSPILAPYSVKSNEPAFTADTVSLRHVRTGQGVQRWELSFDIKTSDNAIDLLLGQLDAASTAQTMIMPQLREALERFTHTKTENRVIGINGAHNVAVTQVAYNMEGSSGTMSGIIPKGTFIKFSNSDKVYVVKADFTTGISSNMQIHPALVKALTGSETVKTGDDVVFTYFTQPDNIVGITFNDGVMSSPGAITLLEAI